MSHTFDKHTCILNDGGTPNRRCDACEEEKASDKVDWRRRYAPGSIEWYLERQRSWSSVTFGTDRRTHGIIEHIRKELLEIEAHPTDLYEWVDVMILAIDGYWRAGGTPELLMQQLIDKQNKNIARRWPDDAALHPDKAAEHVRGSHD